MALVFFNLQTYSSSHSNFEMTGKHIHTPRGTWCLAVVMLCCRVEVPD